MKGKKILILLCLVPFSFQTAAAEEEHTSSSLEFLGKSVNFVLLFGVLTYILYKPLRSFLEARAKKIESTLKETESSRKEAEKKLAEIKERLSRLEEEIARIKEEGKVEGHKEKERIIEEARQEAKRLRRFAEEEIAILTRAGILELKEHAAELATALARERIQGRMTLEMASERIDKSIEKIERLYESSDISQEVHPRVS